MFKRVGRRTYFFILLLITVIVFFDLPKTFYQQDEWQSLGHHLAGGSLSFLNDTNPVLLLFSEKRPLSSFFYSIFLGYYKFTVSPAAIFSILFHALNSILLFILVEKLTKRTLVAFIAALFLIVNSVSHQAVTWVSAMSTLPAAMLILISLISYLKFLDTKINKYKLISFFSIILSLYFKGIGIFLFALLPILYLTYQGREINLKNINKALKENMILLGFAGVMVGVRFAEFFFRSEGVVGYTGGAGSGNFFQTILFRSVLYPLSSFFQIFVPPIDFYSKMGEITRAQYKFLVGSPVIDLVAQSAVSDLLAVIGAGLILCLLGIIVFSKKDKIVKKNIIFALAFFLLSLLPYLALNRDSSYLSSRYFYMGVFPAGVLLGYVVVFFTDLGRYMRWGTLFLVTIFLLHHASIVRADINSQVKLGNERKAVLEEIKKLKPSLSDNTVFYVTSDREYYGLITNPFQNGLGYVLEVWYYDSGKIPKEFLSENFLWDLGAEGYKKSGNRGFGYFQDMDKLTKQVGKGNIKTEDIWAYFIKSKEGRVVDITQEVRERVSTVSASSL